MSATTEARGTRFDDIPSPCSLIRTVLGFFVTANGRSDHLIFFESFHNYSDSKTDIAETACGTRCDTGLVMAAMKFVITRMPERLVASSG
jgi:hypothetical protein